MMEQKYKFLIILKTIRGKIASEDSSTDFEAPQGYYLFRIYRLIMINWLFSRFSTLADQMRKMEFRQWFDLWQILLSNLLLLIQKIKVIENSLLSIFST